MRIRLSRVMQTSSIWAVVTVIKRQSSSIPLMSTTSISESPFSINSDTSELLWSASRSLSKSLIGIKLVRKFALSSRFFILLKSLAKQKKLDCCHRMIL